MHGGGKVTYLSLMLSYRNDSWALAVEAVASLLGSAALLRWGALPFNAELDTNVARLAVPSGAAPSRCYLTTIVGCSPKGFPSDDFLHLATVTRLAPLDVILLVVWGEGCVCSPPPVQLGGDERYEQYSTHDLRHFERSHGRPERRRKVQ